MRVAWTFIEAGPSFSSSVVPGFFDLSVCIEELVTDTIITKAKFLFCYYYYYYQYYFNSD